MKDKERSYCCSDTVVRYNLTWIIPPSMRERVFGKENKSPYTSHVFCSVLWNLYVVICPSVADASLFFIIKGEYIYIYFHIVMLSPMWGCVAC